MTAPAITTPQEARRILIVKLSALGDVFQALGPMKAIRAHHREAHITVLTTTPYASVISATGYADDVWLDTRPRWHQPIQWLKLRQRLRSGSFHMIYDLQTSDRSNAYFRLFSHNSQPFWSGIAAGCSHPHKNPGRDLMHTIERQAEQLRDAGVLETPLPDCLWARDLTCDLTPAEPYGLLAPGGAEHRPGKRWPASHYADLAKHLLERGLRPVLLGTKAESGILNRIEELCPGVINMCNKTTILDILALARNAAVSIGNDTGPMHVVSIAGCPSIVLYSRDSEPALCAQRGPRVEILRSSDLKDLSVDDVLEVLQKITPGTPGDTNATINEASA